MSAPRRAAQSDARRILPALREEMGVLRALMRVFNLFEQPRAA